MFLPFDSSFCSAMYEVVHEKGAGQMWVAGQYASSFFWVSWQTGQQKSTCLGRDHSETIPVRRQEDKSSLVEMIKDIPFMWPSRIP